MSYLLGEIPFTWRVRNDQTDSGRLPFGHRVLSRFAPRAAKRLGPSGSARWRADSLNERRNEHGNLKRCGGVFRLTVRQRGEQYGQVIELPNEAADMLSFWLLRPETVSDEDAEKGRKAIETALAACQVAQREGALPKAETGTGSGPKD